MEDKKIKGILFNSEENEWNDFDVAVICWLLAHDPDELKFWKETKF